MTERPTPVEPRPTGSADRSLTPAQALRRLILPVYLPVLAVNGGAAMLLPILPLYLDDLGFSKTMIGLILAASGVGSALAQIPFGRLLATVGESKVMAGSLVAMAAVTALLGVTALAIGLVILRLAWGAGSVGWLLSRQTFLTRTVEPMVRGRAMSLFGGTTRLAFLLGPLASGVIAARFGFDTAFLVTACVTLAGLLPLGLWLRHSAGPAERTAAKARTTTSLREHRRTLAITGLGQICIITARQGRFIVLPLIGKSIGLETGEIGGLIAIGGLADLVLFPAAGYLMDRYGRLAAIVPSFVLLALGLFALAAVETATGIAVAATVIGIGNGLGSGTMLTLASDLAPAESPSQFLGALGMIRDAGKIAGPVAVGVLADSFDLGVSSIALGLIALVGVFVFVFGVGETRDIDHAEIPAPLLRTNLDSASGA